MKNKLLITSSLVSLFALSGCQEYLTRSDFISTHSGDAVARNASIQTVDPWPSYVYDTDIRTSSERQAHVIKRYHNPEKEGEKGTPQVQLAPAPPPGK